MNIELVTVWNGLGWLDRDCAKGELLPPYASATTLTEATMDPYSHANDGPPTGHAASRRLRTPQAMPDVKTCPRCGLIKSRVDFYHHPGNKDGLFTRCKKCVGK